MVGMKRSSSTGVGRRLRRCIIAERLRGRFSSFFTDCGEKVAKGASGVNM